MCERRSHFRVLQTENEFRCLIVKRERKKPQALIESVRWNTVEKYLLSTERSNARQRNVIVVVIRFLGRDR